MSSHAVTPKPVAMPGFMPTFCVHFILPNVLLAVAGLVTGALGGEYGVPYLVWHDEPAKQYWSGFALSLVVLQTLYVGFMLWGKKVGRPERLAYYPQVLEIVSNRLFGRYAAWIVGQLLVCFAVVTVLILVVQFIDSNAQGLRANAADVQEGVPPPRPHYSVWLALGGLTGTIVVFLGGIPVRLLIHSFSSPGSSGTTRKMMNWLIASAEEEKKDPPCGGLLLTLWTARTSGSLAQRLWMAAFNQMLCVSVGVVFAAVWELSHWAVAAGVSGFMLVVLMLVRARWLHDVRVFRFFIFALGCLIYFVVTWLGSKDWCGWPIAFIVSMLSVVVFGIGVRYAFPVPTTRLLKTTNERIIDHRLCKKYPFHGIAISFFLFGVTMLFLMPMAFDAVRSPMVLACFIIFMVVSLYGFVAYTIDDALPYLAPALLIMVVMSGIPQYKMRFPGLEYTGGAHDDKTVALLDLEKAVAEDVRRQQEFDAEEARLRQANIVLVAGGAVVANQPMASEQERDLAWRRLEEENRVLPGKNLRSGSPKSPPPGALMMLGDIDFAKVPPTTTHRPGDPLPAKKPMVIIVASGGGIRAAAWTFLVLSELEHRFAQEGIAFPYHVRIVTGASGGMFGASYYVQSLKAPHEMTWDAQRRNDMIGANGRFDRLTEDWLTPIMERMVTNDVPAFFSPFSAHTDRGVALEQAWSKKLDGALDMNFEKLAEKEKAGWCPSLVFSPMIVEDGRRLLISNLDMRYPASNDGHLLDYMPNVPPALAERSLNYSHEAMELFRLFPQARHRFNLSTAVRMSASFPYFSPAVPLPTKPRRRVVDAGYFDNYGVSLAASFLFSKKNNEWFKQNVSKIVLVQIRDGQSDDERRLEAIPDSQKRKKGLTSVVSRSLEELTSPLEGLNNGRVGTCSFRNDGLLELLSSYFETLRSEPNWEKIPQSKRFFTVVNFEFPGHAALSWYLSKEEKTQIKDTFGERTRDDEVKAMNAKIEALLKWWKDDVYEPPIDEPIKNRVAVQP